MCKKKFIYPKPEQRKKQEKKKNHLNNIIFLSFRFIFSTSKTNKWAPAITRLTVIILEYLAYVQTHMRFAGRVRKPKKEEEV